MTTQIKKTTEFNKTLAKIGTWTGACAFVVLPILVFLLGGDLDSGDKTGIIIVGVVFGSIIVAVSVFFGLVIPTRIERYEPAPPPGRQAAPPPPTNAAQPDPTSGNNATKNTTAE